MAAMMHSHWILDDDLNLIEVDLMTWARWLEEQDKRGEQNRRIIRRTTFPDGTMVSTVFLGLNHNYGDGPPLLFETMICGPDGAWQDYQMRYATLESARAGHEIARTRARQILMLDAMLEEPAR